MTELKEKKNTKYCNKFLPFVLDSVDDRAGRCQVWIISSGVLICALILCLIPLALISYLYCLKKKQLEKTILANGTSGQFMFPHRVLSF